MDGPAQILFTVVPIPLFAWTMAVAFLGIGAVTARVLTELENRFANFRASAR
jgi:hypothetical protein